MGMVLRSRWRGMRPAMLIAGLLLAIGIPALAFAANTASFSSRTPGSGASTSNTKPTISVKVYDRYGIHGSGSIYMSIDGHAVKPAVVYYTTGTFDPAHPDYRSLKLSYKPSTALSVGTHKVYVKVKDKKAHISTTTWYFKVTGPEPPYSATFSSAKPSSGSTTYTAQPTVSVTVYDKYGVSGTGTYSLSIDGVSLSSKVKYTTTGSTTKLTLSGKPAGALSMGDHTVTATVKDLHKHVTTYSWTFAVAEEPPYTATFSSLNPTDGASIAATQPAISVRVFDQYGVSGAGTYAMTLDGKAVTPTLKYAKTGVYTDLTLSYKPSSALAADEHTVTVSVTDLHGHVSAKTWNFEVVLSLGPLVEMPVTIQSSSCGSCHVGYPSTHPMTACQSCHGPGRPVDGVVYTPLSTSPHTLACATSPCHRTPQAFPHVLGSDCSSCHEGQYSGIPVEHGAPSASVHLSTNTFCTRSGCHAASLTIEHYRHSINGAKLSCATCHSSTDATVAAAVAAGKTDCLACHNDAFTTTPHVHTATAHANAGLSCNQTGCHAADLPTIHKGSCAPCHAPGVTASRNCLDCHSVDVHSSLVAQHTAPDQTCTAPTCHGNNGMAIHLPRGALACQSCHAVGVTPTLVCTTCHTTGYDVLHMAGNAPHPAVVPQCTTAGCHATDSRGTVGDVTIIHAKGPNAPGCAACHAAGKTASVNCLDCHKPHADIAKHQVTNTCTSCHGTDVSVIHTTGTNAPGCVCHQDGKTLTTNCDTAGCHPGGLPTSHVGHESTVTAATIKINGRDYGTHNCSECHATLELQTIHGGTTSCAKCHPTPANTVPQGSFACAQGACHTTANTNPGNMKVMHGSIGTAHAATLPTGWGCTAAGCHDGGTSGGDVAAIHGGTTGPGCVCHKAGHTLTLNCQAADCHPNGAPTDVHEAHESTVTAGEITINGASYGTHNCSECHATLELQTIHGGKTSCAKCHPSPASTARRGDFTCAQGGCHTAASGSMNKMHGSIDASHTATLPAGWSCTTAGCHNGGTSGGDVAKIHTTGAKAPGCVCHESGHTLTLDCQTADCHPDGAPVTHNSHPATVTTGTVTIFGVEYEGVVCSSCHGSPLELQGIHGGSTSCTKCHPSPVKDLGGTWAGGCVQGGCHTTTSGNMKSIHADIDALHAPDPDSALLCGGSNCHGTITSIVAVHAAGPGCAACHAAGKTPSNKCADCHTPHDFDAAHAASPADHTITIGTSTYGPFACSTCHTPLDLRSLHNQVCATCHTTPVKTTLGGTWKQGCIQGGCHTPTSSAPIHGNIETAHAIKLPTGWSCTVSGCHPAADLAALHAPKLGCATCHGNGKTPTADCQASGCHQDGPPASHASHVATLAPTTITIGTASSASVACADCHGSNDLQVIHGGTTSCTKCHPDPATSVTSGTFACAQGNCHVAESTATVAVHANISTKHAISLPTGWSCLQSGCHTGSNLAELHAGKLGCATCHYDGKKPTADCETSGCHTDVVNGLPSNHSTVHDTTVPSGCTGSDCHTPTTNNLTTIHSALSCATCHSSSDTNVKNAIKNHDKSCTTCHTQPHAASHAWCNDCHGYLSGVNTDHPLGSNPQPDQPCANCHGTPFQSLDGGSWVTSTDHIPATCENRDCHDGWSFGPASETYPPADLHTVDVSGGSCVGAGCHGTNLTTIHAAGCATCHAPTSTTISASTVSAAIAAHDKRCTTCHGSSMPSSHTSHVSTQTVGTVAILGTTYNVTCSDCHAGMELQGIHGGTTSCSKCHPTPASTATKGLFNCVQGGCHTTPSGKMKAVHASADASHTATLPSGWTCTVAGCHAGGTSGKDVAAIHAVANGGPGCICHQAGKTLTLTCQASGCHPSGAPTSHASHASTVTAAAISINGTDYGSHNCSECHASMDLQVVHGGPSSCSKCHPSPAKTSNPGVNYACTQSGCHQVTTGNMKAVHTGIDTNHLSATVGNCTVAGCHVGGTDFAKVHSYTTKSCANCHNTTTAPTSNCTASGCHTTTSTANIYTVHPTIGSGHDTGTWDGCNNCHAYCSDCHGDDTRGTDLAAYHTAGKSTGNYGWMNPGYTTNNCLTCHTPGTTSITDCNQCHQISAMWDSWNWM